MRALYWQDMAIGNCLFQVVLQAALDSHKGLGVLLSHNASCQTSRRCRERREWRGAAWHSTYPFQALCMAVVDSSRVLFASVLGGSVMKHQLLEGSMIGRRV